MWALAGHPHVALADVGVLDSSRQLTASIEGGFGVSGDWPNLTIPDVVISQSNPVSSTLPGIFSTSTQASIDYTYTAGGENDDGHSDGYPVYWGYANASQNSLVSNTLLAGTGQYNGSSNIYYPNNNSLLHTEGSSYVVDFYVTSPTPISLSGDIQSSFLNTLDVGTAAQTTFSLTSNLSATPIYAESAVPLPGFGISLSVVDSPLSYQGWLEPGQTYTLSVDAESTDLFYGSAYYLDQDSGSFSFTATVPEPTGVLLLVTAVALTLKGRRTHSRLSGSTPRR
jgi:hypothetical protein